MPYDTTNALSKQFTLQYLHARISNYLAMEVKNSLTPGQITNAIQARMMHFYVNAYEAVRMDYHKMEPNVTVTAGVANLATLGGVKEVTGVLGVDGTVYDEAHNIKDLWNTSSSSEGTETAGAKKYYFMREGSKLYVALGNGMSADATVTVTFVRTPMVNFTYGEVQDTDNYADIPDEWINFVVVGSAYDLSAEQREKMGAQLSNDYTNFVARFDEAWGINRAKREAQHKD